LLIYYLAALIPFAALGYVLWAYRRKAAEKEAARQERLTLLMVESQREASQGELAPVAAPAKEAVPARKEPAWVARGRFLSPPEAVVYYLLKTALRRDHEIYVHVGLAAVVTVGEKIPSFEREQRLRRLAQHDLTFVICDKSLSVVAALELNQEATAADQELKAECLKSAGIRLIQLDPAALPPRDAIRALIYGGAR
jgi:intracellular sulfur oxidation DsrE/DsrF family protein